MVLGGTLSAVLPVVNSLFTSGEVTEGSNGGGYFGGVISLYKQLLPESEYKEIIPLALLLVMMVISSGIQFVIVWVNSGLTAKLTCDCRERIYDSIQKMKFSAMGHYSRGMFVQLLITETRSVYAVFKQVLQVIATFMNSLVVIVLLVLLSWKLSMVLFAGFLLVIAVNLCIVKTMKRLARVALNLRTNLTSHVTEAIWGLKQSKLLQAEPMIAEALNGISRRSEDVARRLAVKNGLQPLLTQNLSIACVFLVIGIWILVPVFSEEVPKIAGLITFLVLTSRLIPSISAVSKGYGTIFANLPAVGMVHGFLSNNIESEKGGDYEPSSFLKNRIEVRNIHFGYTSDKPVLGGINLEVKAGSYIGIVGSSGGGKSTLLNLFTRLYDPIDGDIYIDDVDIKEFPLSYLRSHIGMISQDFFLFDATIKENLLLAKPSARDQDIWDALDKAGLAVFAHSLDKKLDTSVGNNGERLSEGQRQRLCLATIFLRNPDVVILDEGTSSVDKDTERHILSSLRELHHQGKMIISSAHKETALVDAERIYQLVDGTLRVAT